MLDRLSIPRRALDFEDYIDIFRRNIRWIIGPAFAGIVISTVVAYIMEDTFVSAALIRVVPQQISGEIVRSISAQDVSDRINSMAQQIESRSTLSALISTYGLYKNELKSEPMEDVLTTMKAAIVIRPTMGVTNIQSGRNLPAMQVQFSYRDRIVAMKVCSDLVSRFMSASSQETLQGQVSANSFLTDEFDHAKRDLEAAEQKLQDYRIRNAGKLPEQMQQNIAQMSALDQRLSSLSDAATRNSERRMMLDTQLHIAKDRLSAVRSSTSSSQAHNEKVLEIDKEIEDLQTNIASMKDRYTDEHPDMQAAKDRLAVLKRQRDDAAKAQPAKSTEPVSESPLVARERMDAQATVEAIQSNIKATELEQAGINKEIGSLNSVLRGYQARVQESPAGEKEYAELQRDYDSAKAQFETFQQKMQLSRVSLNLERQKQGETLELLDAASTPTTPTAPKRSFIIPIGLVGGLVVGFILVAIREVRDTSLKNLKDARLYTQLSILGSIPLLENDVVVQRRKQVMWVGWATATILGIAIMAGSVAHYYLSKA
jgi:succinoglycan biosynthesis transport protein ExoP